VNRELKNERRV